MYICTLQALLSIMFNTHTARASHPDLFLIELFDSISNGVWIRVFRVADETIRMARPLRVPGDSEESP
jgi:hypothetical protein